MTQEQTLVVQQVAGPFDPYSNFADPLGFDEPQGTNRVRGWARNNSISSSSPPKAAHVALLIHRANTGAGIPCTEAAALDQAALGFEPNAIGAPPQLSPQNGEHSHHD